MKKIFLLGYSLFLFAGVKAQQPKTKNTGVIEYREGNSPELKKQQKQDTKKAVSTPAQRGQTTQKPVQVDSIRFGTNVGRSTTADRNAKRVRELLRKTPPGKPNQKQTDNTSKQMKKSGQ